ncbi:patatin-like phospholipase family protein [Candidatus Woesearchaeota archaeon]|nr:patatin-like phospholipase family protein [Candidatus Woesearchaeota archaeon]
MKNKKRKKKNKHIGVLKVLHEAGITPDFLAGTSMGSVIGALYAAGKSPEVLEELVKTTDWQKMMDVKVPKTGFLQGKIVEEHLRKLLWNKPFHRLKIPFQVVAYNLTKKKEVIFSAGDVAEAVRASISIPGVFSPAHIKRDEYIDGAVVNPTPYDVVRKMGAEVVIAVDLFPKKSSMQGPLLQKSSLIQDFEEKFVEEELREVKKLIFPEAWPAFLRKIFIRLFDKLLFPARVLRVMTGKELPPIGKVMLNTTNILINNLARERLKHAEIEIKITPEFEGLSWADFDKADTFIALGEKAMTKELPKLKKMMGKRL